MRNGDYGDDYRAELRRLEVSLRSRVIRKEVRGENELTDRQLTRLFRYAGFCYPGGCWLWIGPRDRNGYGRFVVGDRRARNRQVHFLAHRAMYEVLRGPIPAGLTLDHLCRVTSCVNPDHLDPCSIGENTSRSPLNPSSINRAKTVCPRGHPLDGVSVVKGGRTQRYCKTCNREWLRQYRRRQKVS